MKQVKHNQIIGGIIGSSLIGFNEFSGIRKDSEWMVIIKGKVSGWKRAFGMMDIYICTLYLSVWAKMYEPIPVLGDQILVDPNFL